MMNEAVSGIMSRNLVTITPNETLEAARNLLKTKRIHHLPVVVGKKLVGIVTTYDMFKLDLDHSKYNTLKVSDIMTTHIATIEPSDKVGTAAEIFLEHLFHAIPVLENGELVGIVTSLDIIKYEFRKEYPNQEIK